MTSEQASLLLVGVALIAWGVWAIFIKLCRTQEKENRSDESKTKRT